MTEQWQGTLHWSLETLEGESVAAGEEAVEVAPLATTQVNVFDMSAYVNDDKRRNLIFIAELQHHEHVVARQTAFFAPTKHLQLTDPKVTATCRSEGDVLHIELTSHSLARLVELSLTGADAVFSDNYFDLPATRTVTVTSSLPAGWTASQAEAALRIRSVYDSFAVS